MSTPGQQMQAVTGPAQARGHLMNQLADQGYVCWSLAERPGQLAWALLCGCGNPDPILRAVLPEEEHYRVATRKLLRWAAETELPRGRTPSARHLRAVMDILEGISAGCLEAELLSRVRAAGRNLNAVELPDRSESLQLFLGAGALHVSAGEVKVA